MVYKLFRIEDLEATVNEIEKYDVVILYKYVRSNRIFTTKTRMGEYIIYDGDNECTLICDKSLLNMLKTTMNNRGYRFSNERRGRSR